MSIVALISSGRRALSSMGKGTNKADATSATANATGPSRGCLARCLGRIGFSEELQAPPGLSLRSLTVMLEQLASTSWLFSFLMKKGRNFNSLLRNIVLVTFAAKPESCSRRS